MIKQFTVRLLTAGVWALGALLCGFYTANAQIRLQLDSLVEGQIGEILTLKLEITNLVDEQFQGHVHIRHAPDLRILGERERTIDLEAGAKRFVPVRVRLEQNAASGDLPIEVALVDMAGDTVDQAHATISVKDFRNIWLQALTHRELMQHPGDSIHIPIYIKNAGNTSEDIRLLIATPVLEGSSNRKFETIDLAMRPAQDTTVILGMVVDQRMLDYEHFYVNITGLYHNTEVFGDAHISVQNAASRRSFVNPLREYDVWASQQNQISLSSRNLFLGRQTWELQGRAAHRFEGDRALSYQWNVQQWESGKTPMINNTWIRVDQRDHGFTLGNLSETAEKHLYGRGVKAHWGSADAHRVTEFGLLDKGYNLVGPQSNDRWFDGYSVFIQSRNQHRSGPKSMQYHTVALYDRDRSENAESALVAQSLAWVPDVSNQKIHLQFHLGGGLSRQLDTPPPGSAQATPEDWGRVLKPSVAGSVSINTSIGRYTLTSNNHYSSGYYPGTRRGTVQLNQRITRKSGAKTGWIAYNLTRYEPSYFNSQTAFPVYFFQSRSEVGMSQPLGAFATWTISPRIETEQGHFFDPSSSEILLLDQQNLKMQSFFSWRSRNSKHFASLSQEMGWMTRINFDSDHRFHSRSTLSYSFRKLHVIGLYQYGHVTVGDHLYGKQTDRAPLRSSLNVNWAGQFVNKRLQVDLGGSVYDDYLSGGGISTNSRLQFNLQRTAFFAHGQWFRYRNGGHTAMPVVYAQAGIIRKLPTNETPQVVKKGKMVFSVFYDYNNNGRFDEGDEIASGKSVLINNTLFLSDSQGEIQYTRVPYGNYRLQIPVENGWHAPEQSFTLERRTQSWAIPLQQSGSLRGLIRFDYDPRLSLQTNTSVEGFSVTAKATNGKIFQSRTDNEGRFLLFLPVGSYDVYLSEREFPNHVYSDAPLQQVTITAGEVQVLDPFELNIHKKSIEVKRFH